MTGTAKHNAKQAADSKPLEALARIGLISYGVVHILVGWLALQVAFPALAGGSGGAQETDQSGALKTLAGSPFGDVILWLVAIGLIALAVWQASEAIWGLRDKEGAKRVRKQITTGARAVVYAALGISAARVALGGGSSSAQSQQKTTSGVLALPAGQLLVVIAGLIVIGVGVAHIIKGVKTSFMKEIDTSSMPPAARTGVERLGQFGYLAKGAALGVVGAILVYAAITFDPAKATGLDGALQKILEQPFGQILLTLVALGFVAFGLFSFAQSRYKRL